MVDDSGAPVSGMATRLAADVATWESAAGADVFGSGSTDTSYDASTASVDAGTAPSSRRSPTRA